MKGLFSWLDDAFGYIAQKVDRNNAKKELSLRARFRRVHQQLLNSGDEWGAHELEEIFEHAVKNIKAGVTREGSRDESYKIPNLKRQIEEWHERAELARQQGKHDLVRKALAHRSTRKNTQES